MLIVLDFLVGNGEFLGTTAANVPARIIARTYLINNNNEINVKTSILFLLYELRFNDTITQTAMSANM